MKHPGKHHDGKVKAHEKQHEKHHEKHHDGKVKAHEKHHEKQHDGNEKAHEKQHDGKVKAHEKHHEKHHDGKEKAHEKHHDGKEKVQVCMSPIEILIKACVVAHKRGCYTFKEAEIISKAFTALKVDDDLLMHD